MSTEDYLAQLVVTTDIVTMDTARDFIMENINEPQVIYGLCKYFNVNNDMIADILQSEFPGLTGQIVSDFFTSNGFDGNSLGFNALNQSIDIVSDGNYSGQYNGDQLGTFSFVVNDDDITGSWYSPTWDETGSLSGYVNNETGALSISSSDEDGVPITFTGQMLNDDASGTWNMPIYGNGTFSADLII